MSGAVIFVTFFLGATFGNIMERRRLRKRIEDR